MKRYVFEQHSGNVTTMAVVEKPFVKEGALYATKVGKFDSIDDDGNMKFILCAAVEFMAGGNWTLTEYTGKLTIAF